VKSAAIGRKRTVKESQTMGVLGWNDLGDNVQLVGTVVNHFYSDQFLEGDGDWSLVIKPDPEFAHLAVNSSGAVNPDQGNIECEVLSVLGKSSEESVLGPLMGKKVSVWGHWVEDISHDHKTEIHPMSTLLLEDPVAGYSKRFQVLVQCDNSGFNVVRPFSPPDAKTAIDSTVWVQFPPVVDDDLSPTCKIINEHDLSNSKSFVIIGSGLQFLVKANVNVSPDDNNHMYYRGLVELGYDSSAEPTWVGVMIPDDRANFLLRDQDPNTFGGESQTMTDGGTPPHRVRTYVVNGQRLWAGIFLGSSAGNTFQWYRNWEDFMGLWAQFYPTMCLIDVVTFVENGERMWGGIWEDSFDGNGIFSSTDPEALKVQQTAWGMPLVNIKTYVDGGERVWFGIYRGNGTTTTFSYGLTFEQLIGQVGQYSGQQKLIAIETYVDSGQRRWASIWENTPSSSLLVWGYSDYFGQTIQQNFEQYGFRLVSLAVSRGWE
jgi:hypothetical protein